MEKITKKDKKSTDNTVYFDYKNTDLLSEYINTHARITSRRKSKLSAHEQRSLAQYIKRARFMALMPYIAR